MCRSRHPEVPSQARRPRLYEGRPRELPLEWYCDPIHFEHERSRALWPAWHAIGRLDQIPDSGARLVAKLLGEEIVVERAPSGLAAHCEPDMDVRVEAWNGFVMANLDAGAAPLATQITPLTEYLAPYGLADRAQLELVEVDADWDWKLSLEHFSSANGLDWAGGGALSLVEFETNDAWSLRYWKSAQCTGRRLPSALTQRVSALNVYPTLHLLADAAKALWLRIAVEGPERHRLCWKLLVPRNSPEIGDMAERLEHYRELLGVLIDDHIGILRANIAEPRESRDRQPYKSIEQMHRWLWRRLSGFELTL